MTNMLIAAIFLFASGDAVAQAPKASADCFEKMAALLEQTGEMREKLVAELPDEEKEVAKYCTWGRATYLPTLKKIIAIWQANLSLNCGVSGASPKDFLERDKGRLDVVQKNVDAACKKAGI